MRHFVFFLVAKPISIF